MSEPLKGGFASFTSGTPFKLAGNTGAAPATNLFGNAAQIANTGTNPQTPQNATGTPTNLFGNAAAKPPTTGLFGGGAAGASSTPTPATGTGTGTGTGSNLFGGGFGAQLGTTASSAPSTSATTSTTAPATSTSAFGGNLFGAKPAEQSTNAGASGTSTTPQPSGNLFGGFGNTASSQPASTSSTTTTNMFGRPADTNTSTTTAAPAAPAGGSLFGNNLFGKKPDTPTPAGSSTTPASGVTTAAPSLFAGLGNKKDEGVDKDKEKTAAPATTGLFRQPAGNKDTPAGTTGTTTNSFGQNPTEKKDNAPEGEKKDTTVAPALSASALGRPSGTSTPAPTSISVPPPSMLRGKTIEEIVNKWSSELETHVREFNRLAGEVAVWDRALIDNGNTIAALFQHVVMAEREQSDIEQSLKLVEDQQKELASTLEIYEKSAGEIFDVQGGGLRALDVGPADAERDKHYTLAAELNTNLDDLSRSLLQMIDSVNALSDSPEGASGGEDEAGKTKNDAPLEQIAQILSSHLESLQWIDSAVREVDTKVNDVERLVRDASSGSRNGSASSLSGSVNGTGSLSGSRGFGLR